jgi:large subunit ribosomal protein L22
MEVKAVTKFARISPMKARDIARELSGMKAEDASDLLEVIPRKAAGLIQKTLKSAIANAENNNNVSSSDLVIKTIQVDKGPVFKRFRPVARGMAHPYAKGTSHITIVLTDEAPEAAALATAEA